MKFSLGIDGLVYCMSPCLSAFGEYDLVVWCYLIYIFPRVTHIDLLSGKRTVSLASPGIEVLSSDAHPSISNSSPLL